MKITRSSLIKKTFFSAAAITVLGVGTGFTLVTSGSSSSPPQPPSLEPPSNEIEYRMTPKIHTISNPIIDKFILSIERNLPGTPVMALITVHLNSHFYDDPESQNIVTTSPPNAIPMHQCDSMEIFLLIFKLADIARITNAKTRNDIDLIIADYDETNWPPLALKERTKAFLRIPRNDFLIGGGRLLSESTVVGKNEVQSNELDIEFDPFLREVTNIEQLDGNGIQFTIGKIETGVNNWSIVDGEITLTVRFTFSDVINAQHVNLGLNLPGNHDVTAVTLWQTHPKDHVFQRPDLRVPPFGNLEDMLNEQEIEVIFNNG